MMVVCEKSVEVLKCLLKPAIKCLVRLDSQLFVGTVYLRQYFYSDNVVCMIVFGSGVVCLVSRLNIVKSRFIYSFSKVTPPPTHIIQTRQIHEVGQ